MLSKIYLEGGGGGRTQSSEMGEEPADMMARRERRAETVRKHESEG